MANSFPAPLRVSAVQCSIHWNDVSANLQLIESLIRDYAAMSDLIVFPETITTGFSSEAAKLADREQGEVYQTLLRLSHEYNVALAWSCTFPSGSMRKKRLCMTPLTSLR